MAKKLSEIGMYFSISGIVTFKNNKITKEFVKNFDLSKIILETDSPCLCPHPFRGEINKPSNLKYIAETIAQIKEIDVEIVKKTTSNNVIRMFDLKI